MRHDGREGLGAWLPRRRAGRPIVTMLYWVQNALSEEDEIGVLRRAYLGRMSPGAKPQNHVIGTQGALRGPRAMQRLLYLPGLGRGGWLLPAIVAINLKIQMQYEDPKMEIRTLDCYAIAASSCRTTPLTFKRVWRQTLAVARLSPRPVVYRASSLVDLNADAGFKASKNMATSVVDSSN
ncbi:hypothetical protein F5882DRAFT_482213 [Hyaloscypha sp. PMI_1271]|nr:hypothetical protein F5882DRAFT_482213 [Hyaloscypha sp. PMI_1271]